MYPPPSPTSLSLHNFIRSSCSDTSQELIGGFYQCGALFFLLLFGRRKPGEESANGRRALGVKVDVVGVGGGVGWLKGEGGRHFRTVPTSSG